MADIAEKLGILQLGHPGLRQQAPPVDDFGSSSFRDDCDRLLATLETFRARAGFGRGIAAPQLGIARSLVALNVEQCPPIIANPIITWASPETFTMWDDCMSFPDLLVRVRRASSLSLRYQTVTGESKVLLEVDRSLAELLQHEIDHLHGVLALDRALDRESIVSRSVYERFRDSFDESLDTSGV